MGDGTETANSRNRIAENGAAPAGQTVKTESAGAGQAGEYDATGAGQAGEYDATGAGQAGKYDATGAGQAGKYDATGAGQSAGKESAAPEQGTNTVSDAPGQAGQKAASQGDNKLIRLLTSEGMRYLFIGGCTTMVNLVVYAVLCRVVRLNVNISNIISVSVSILFAYVTNKLIVFRSHCSSISELAAECARFIGARLATMVIEVGGVFVLYEILHQNEMVAKLATQVLVVIGNYFISRFIVFKDRT